MSNCLYLRSNVQAEPLINQWYAWHLLINPATYSLIMKNLHVPIMSSYIKAPHIHKDTANKPQMKGGPFVDFYGEYRVMEISALLDKTITANSDLLTFAKGLGELNQLLNDSACGGSLSPLYEKVPDILKGYVELVYDLNNNPSFRFIEGLLFRSKFYKDDAQSLLFSLTVGDERPFVLSTPRMPSIDHIKFDFPFNHIGVDEIFLSRTKGIQRKRALALFEDHCSFITSDSQQKFLDLFDDHPQPRQENVKPGYENIRIRYYGHACVLVETSEISVLIDPLISYNCMSGPSRYTFDDLPDKIDYVLMTHAHQDHVMFETLLQIRNKVETFVVPKNNPGALQDMSLKKMLEAIGFKSVVEISELDSIAIPNGEIIGIPFLGEHGDLNITSKIAFLICVNKKKLLFVADSNNLEPAMYSHLSQLFSPVDIIFLGMECEGAPMSWLYGALFLSKITRSMDQSRRLDGSDAICAQALIKAFDCKQAYVYAMGQEPWLSYITSIFYSDNSRPIIESNKLIEIGKQQNFYVERLYIKKEIII